jgi:hypothetical protein
MASTDRNRCEVEVVAHRAGARNRAALVTFPP